MVMLRQNALLSRCTPWQVTKMEVPWKCKVHKTSAWERDCRRQKQSRNNKARIISYRDRESGIAQQVRERCGLLFVER